MLDACIINCIIVCVLSGVALVANVGVCLYTLHLSKQAERQQYLEGFTAALIERELKSEEYGKEGTE